jgi:hypothetical protein
MTAQVWPFKQRGDVIESLEWLTDVFRAKAGEQRIALRTAPRRIFNLSHLLDDREYSAAQAMIRQYQGNGDFLAPDWPQAIVVGAVSPGSGVSLSIDLSYTDMGADAILWQSADDFEQVQVINDSNGVSLTTVTGSYSNALLVPLWAAHCPEGLANSRTPAQINECSVAMYVYDNSDLGFSGYPQYRGHDVMTSCPIIGAGDFSEDIGWPLTAFDNRVGVPYYLRQRTIPDLQYQMRWHEFTGQDAYELRQWIHSRRGRQKVFWMSSRAKDLDPAASIAGTTVTIFTLPGITGLGRSEAFDIDITTTAGASYYRRVSSATAGAPISGRGTINMTIDSSLSVTLSAIKRISFLRCTRFDADRIELNHSPSAGMSVQVPCVEVLEP